MSNGLSHVSIGRDVYELRIRVGIIIFTRNASWPCRSSKPWKYSPSKTGDTEALEEYALVLR